MRTFHLATKLHVLTFYLYLQFNTSKRRFIGLNITNTYRAIAATFFIVAITQVFVLQSAHHICEHTDEEIACESKGAHFHSIEQSHLSCDICFFQLSPSESTDTELGIIQPNKFFYFCYFFSQ